MNPDTRYPLNSRADVITASPARYAKQLVSHLGRKVAFVADGDTHTATVGEGRAQIVVGDGVLTLLAAAETESHLERLEQALGGHLERFGQRAELAVTWDRPGHPRP
jgi:hypothetical protein